MKKLTALFILIFAFSAFGQAKLKRATGDDFSTVVVISGVETNTFNMDLDWDSQGQAKTSGFYELFVLVSGYTANGTTGRITVKPRDFTRATGGVKTFVTSTNDSVNVTTSMSFTAAGLFNFHFEIAECPSIEVTFVSVGADDFSIQPWIRYLGE